MKNFVKISVSTSAILASFGLFTAFANAASLEVTFTPPTLFSEASFMPGDDASGVVTVTNNSGASQTVLTEAINITDGDNFGSMLQLVIKEGSNTLFNDSLATFFSTAGEVTLGSISNGESKTFDFDVSFTGADNAYQEKSLGFDVCVGFQGGTTHCGDTVVGGEDGDVGGGGTITGGGGGINFIPLTISSEQEQNINLILNQTTITWNTNKLATSQVVYGPDTSTYTLDLDAPNFGYPFSTIEDPTKVFLHSVTLTGLSPGQTYVYRAVSRASPPTISAERRFSFSLPFDIGSPLALNNQNNTNNTDQTFSSSSSFGNGAQNNTGSPGSVLGTSTVNENILNLDEEGAEENIITNGDDGLALASSSGFKNFNYWYLFLLIILILLYLSWRYWRNKNR